MRQCWHEGACCWTLRWGFNVVDQLESAYNEENVSAIWWIKN
jgi:hypothetical protein